MKKSIISFCLFYIILIQTANAQLPVLYGMTSEGGQYGNGTIIKVNGDGTGFDTVYSFDIQQQGYQPWGSLVKASNDILYGLTLLGGTQDRGVIFSFNPANNIYTDLYNFNYTLGASPKGNLIQASNGIFYGMTSGGGANAFGVIFSFDSTAGYKDLHDFDNSDGLSPYGSLLQVGNILYGMTSGGGDFTDGVIFSYNITTNTFLKLYDFNVASGGVPYGSLVEGPNGILYGTTSAGNTDTLGTIFSFNPNGNVYTDLYNFHGSGIGNFPGGSLILANDNELYGMTELGGNTNNGVGYGTIFSFNPNGNTFSNLYDFNGVNGDEPYGSLLQGSDGNLYGMTAFGGNYTFGNIFSYNISNNTVTNFISFNDTLGSTPYGDLIQTSPTSGINQISAISSQVSIFPNPTSGIININAQQNIDKLTVTNLLGQLIYESEPKQAQYNIDIKEEGMYFVTFTSNNTTTTKKILVVK